MKRRILLSASLFHSINDAATVTLPMIFPLLYSQQFIISRYAHIGMLSYLGLFTTFLFQILIVQVASSWEYKHMLLVSIIGISLFLALITQSRGIVSLLILYLILRSLMSFYHPIGITIVSRSHPDKGLDFAMGIQSGSGNLGVFLAFITVGYLAQHGGWTAPLFTWAAVVFCIGLLSFMTVRHTRDLRGGMKKPDIRLWLKTAGDLKPLIPGFIFGGACWGTTVYYAPSLLNHRFDVPLGRTGVFLAAWIAVGAVMPYLFGLLSRKLGRRNIAAMGLVGSTLLVTLLGASQELGLAAFALLGFGAFLFLIYPAFQSYVGSLIPPQNQAVAFSLVANVLMLTGACAGLIAGFLSDSLGINSPFLFLGSLGVFVSGYYLFRPTRLP